MTIKIFHMTAAAAGLALALSAPASAEPQTLGSYPIDPAKVSISGISSGAYMANQFHVAHSELVMGAGLVAGGLYSCATKSIAENGTVAPTDLSKIESGPCMHGEGMETLPPVSTYVDRITALAKNDAKHERIDALTGLEGDRVYLFTGTNDRTVQSAVLREAGKVYEGLGVKAADIALDDKTKAGHTWATIDKGIACDLSDSPYIGKCNEDLSGNILNHIYGARGSDGTIQPTLAKPTGQPLSGEFVTFRQAEFVKDWEKSGLNHEGYLYVPASCKPDSAGPKCALHVVLHGCKQTSELLKDGFYKTIGVNEWADANNIVVLYPQTRVLNLIDSFASNPNACWNWWGYAYDQNYLYKTGVQINAIHQMVRRVMGQPS